PPSLLSLFPYTTLFRSLQRDVTELMEFYARNTFELADEEKLELLRRLHNVTVASKMYVMGNRSTVMFDFLVDMDDLQILELVRKDRKSTRLNSSHVKIS